MENKKEKNWISIPLIKENDNWIVVNDEGKEVDISELNLPTFKRNVNFSALGRLIIALQNNDLKEVEFLLNNFIDINDISSDNYNIFDNIQTEEMRSLIDKYVKCNN